MASSRVQLISKKLVKPSIPTPPSLRNYKLNILDQLIYNEYAPMAFFYPNYLHQETPQNSHHLLESLSKTLTSYYTFAGRLNDNISIDCNDKGITFLEARIECPMSDILKAPTTNPQNIVYPSGLPWSIAAKEDSPVVAQLSHFDCGGTAVSVCLAHKYGDVQSLCNFISHWASVSRKEDDNISPPQLIGDASLIPTREDPPEDMPHHVQGKQLITRKFVFDVEKLRQLKARASAESGVENPTRIEVVSALIDKCAINATKACAGSFKPSVLGNVVNLRPLMGPPMTLNFVGSPLYYLMSVITDEKEVEFSRLVSLMRREKKSIYGKLRGIKPNELLSMCNEMAEEMERMAGKHEFVEYVNSSICRFPMYDTDFGWGRPCSVTMAACLDTNRYIYVDSPDGRGVDALITMQEDVMSVFQRDLELLRFAYPDPKFSTTGG